MRQKNYFIKTTTEKLTFIIIIAFQRIIVSNIVNLIVNNQDTSSKSHCNKRTKMKKRSTFTSRNLRIR